MASSSSVKNIEERVKTDTGERLRPPIIRVERCRCVGCGANPDLVCKECKEDIVFCKKCGRRAKHQHPLKSFRPKDESILQLRKHLTLSYYEHLVSCEKDICLETCETTRHTRFHFRLCPNRPAKLRDMIVDGQVRFDAISGTACHICGLFITCLFLHANKCQKAECNVDWCQEIREIFDMTSRDIYVISDVMRAKCEGVLKSEWEKVEHRKRDLMVEDLLAISI